MSLAEERMLLNRQAEWSTDEVWRAKVHVREQLTSEDYLEAHRLEGTTPCAYATTLTLCKECADIEKKKLANPGIVNPRGRENSMWKGRVVDVLPGMRPLTEMAVSKVRFVMQV